MKKAFAFSFTLLCGLTAAPAFATVTVGSPGNGADLSSPFTLSANASTCSSQPVASMGYSFDNSTDTTIVNSTSINAQVSAGSGAHTLHVKAWGNQGAACVSDVSVTVITSSESSSIIPPGATNVSSIESLNNWIAAYDSNSGVGGSSGSMSIVSSPSQNGHAREFLTKFSNSGGERYSVTFGDDETATNFFYDGWIYLTSSSSQIGNLELDMNQTMSNGQTVIFGFQCDGYSSTWDYTKNAGSPTRPVDQWVHSGAYCNPRAWAANMWHHVQVYYSRDSSGNVTYHSVWFDDQQANINATVNSAFALGWGPVLLTNFQVDGVGASGSPNVYLDDLRIYRW
ncbi:MAG TPA: hypothetical protein VFE27_18165 [Acidobacteriaceae bacterium]|jgi:hypothetical protein|nr:hypothetical protein [Acidobacteriaceae bacterium]